MKIIGLAVLEVLFISLLAVAVWQDEPGPTLLTISLAALFIGVELATEYVEVPAFVVPALALLLGLSSLVYLYDTLSE